MDTSEVQNIYTKKASYYQFLMVDFLGFGMAIEKFFREFNYVGPHFKILDAGCGTGNATRALYTIASEKGYEDVTFHAFDLTQAMLDLFQQWIKKVGANNIILKRSNVLDLEQLPSDWNGYDAVVSTAMLEHLPKDSVRPALRGLKQLLKHNGRLLVVITRRNIINKFIGWRWKNNTYDKNELQKIFLDGGFSEFKIRNFFWNFMFIIEAKNN
ncbi:class I SAM-dependent methyltransferase [Candidatus Roizmanbacteria bacterium]|nr:class I SAM-dependent methyltransferase [Candidatus Roizmanbacteria bacterium]